jgi:hypothetical protein
MITIEQINVTAFLRVCQLEMTQVIVKDGAIERFNR